MEDYITLTEAARVAGYLSKSTLKAAAADGRLKTIKPAPNLRMTTRPWLEEYLTGTKARGNPRGEPKGQRDPADAWVYTPEWQAGMQEAQADIAAGRFTRYHSDEEFLASFAEPAAQHANVR